MIAVAERSSLVSSSVPDNDEIPMKRSIAREVGV
jgi:hypothetical protein